MYEYIKGKIHSKSPEEVTLDVQGVGYLLRIPSSTFTQLRPEQEEQLLYVTLLVREDSQTLYGFCTKQERSLFLLLRGVSGIGPKTALSLVGHLDLPLFQTAVSEKRPQVIAKVPGIGPKTASRIIVEMSDKISVIDRLRRESSLLSVDPLSLDAIAALVHLGYSQQVAKKAVDQVRRDYDALNTLIPAALQVM